MPRRFWTPIALLAGLALSVLLGPSRTVLAVGSPGRHEISLQPAQTYYCSVSQTLIASGLSVRNVETGQTTITDNTGYWILSHLPSGNLTFVVTGSNTTNPVLHTVSSADCAITNWWWDNQIPQAPAPPPPPPSTSTVSGTCTFSGHETDGGTGADIAGMEMKVLETGQLTYTDTRGYWYFSFPGAGTYTIVNYDSRYRSKAEHYVLDNSCSVQSKVTDNNLYSYGSGSSSSSGARASSCSNGDPNAPLCPQSASHVSTWCQQALQDTRPYALLDLNTVGGYIQCAIDLGLQITSTGYDLWVQAVRDYCNAYPQRCR